MERIAIIDHERHKLFVEDISDEVLESPDWNGEEAWILNNYDVENFSWDYITDAQYYPENNPYGYPFEIDFEDIADI